MGDETVTFSTRLVRRSDAGGILGIYAPIVADTATSFELQPPSDDEIRSRIAGALRFAPWVIVESDAGIAGYAYAQRHRARAAYRWSVETSVFVDEEFRGHGVGRALMETLLDLLALQGFQRCFAGVTLPNEASVRLHESLGFQALGTFRRVGYKLGRWHDVGWWQTDLQPPEKDPSEPIQLANLGEEDNLAGMPTDDLRRRLAACRDR